MTSPLAKKILYLKRKKISYKVTKTQKLRGKKMKITMREIDEQFTQMVAEKLANGFEIYTKPMRGSQGEIAKITFKKDEKYYVLFLDQISFEQNFMDCYRICFAEASENYKGCDTLWLSQAKPIKKNFFYIGKYSRIYTTLEEAEKTYEEA